METISYPAEAVSAIQLQIAGNLKVRGWDEPVVEAKVSGKGNLSISEEAGQITLQAQSNTTLSVPAGADLDITAVEGNVKGADLSGALKITRVAGNLKLANVGPVAIEKVYGNANIRGAAGPLSLVSVYGNLKVSDIAGEVSAVENIKGNMVLTAVQGASAEALGNTTLSIYASEGETYDIKATGNIHCYLDPDSSAAISAHSSAGNIRLDLPEQNEHLRETDHSLALGAGQARVNLSARGYIHIALRDRQPEPPPQSEDLAEIQELENMSEEINHLIDKQMEALEEQINETLSHIDEAESNELTSDIDEIVEQARQYSTLAALEAQASAEAAADQAQAKLIIKLEKAKQKAAKKQASGSEGRKRRWSGAAGRANKGASNDVTEEERLMVLKMVEEDKISLEEADELLAALEGKGS